MSARAKRILKIILVVSLCIILSCGMALFGVNMYVKSAVDENIISLDAAYSLGDIDCIIVLGCLVKSDGEPSNMLSDRLDVGIELYKSLAAPKLLMSGDHGSDEYDEVNAMKQYAIAAGVPSEDVFMDHAGFSTYDSIYRAKAVFGADKILIVTQEYHLYRALYIAEAFGVEAYGVSADLRSYSGQLMRDGREFMARTKDLIFSVVKPRPKYLGDPISLETSGDVTNDIKINV